MDNKRYEDKWRSAASSNCSARLRGGIGGRGRGRAGVGLRRESRARWGVSERANPGHQRFLLAVSGISKTAVFDSSQRGAATIPPPDSISCLRRPSRGPGFFASGDRMQIRTCARAHTRGHANTHAYAEGRQRPSGMKEGGGEGRREGRDGLQWLLKASCPPHPLPL